MNIELGKTIGGYAFIDFLGASKLGAVYKVRNVLAQRFEMLRLLPNHMQNDQEHVERFLREMKVHARLTHPNILSFYNATEINGRLAMTAELVEGTTLAGRLELGPVPYRQAVNYTRQILSALGCAHAKGVVHREITPANMIVTHDGTIKLTGFSYAKGPTDPQLTRVGAIRGSLKYLSPEQVKGSSTVDARSDIYSLGVSLYELVTGSTPFNSKSEFEVLAAHVNTPPTPPGKLNPQIPSELDRIILKALAKDPSERFQSTGEFREALDNFELSEKTANAASEQAAELCASRPALACAESSPVDSAVTPELQSRYFGLTSEEEISARVQAVLDILGIRDFARPEEAQPVH